jgi:hypothetical protein
MHGTHTMEQYSVAFVHALATRARCKIANLVVDDEQVDLTIRQSAEHKVFQRTMVDVQLKCTAQDSIRSDGLHFELSEKHYNGLRVPGIVKKILVVLAVDPDFDKWMLVQPSELLLRGSAYWTAVDGWPDITTESKTVVLPDQNRFNVDSLLDMLQRVGEGGVP